MWMKIRTGVIFWNGVELPNQPSAEAIHHCVKLDQRRIPNWTKGVLVGGVSRARFIR